MRVLVAIVLCAALVPAAAAQESGRPNVVFILVDDLGWTDLGSYGSTFYETPNIDHLAASGMRFTEFYTPSPVCSPTRSAIMTGKHPVRVGITDWIPGRPPKDRKLLQPDDVHQLALDEVTLAEAFKEQGYATFFAGKWHLGSEGHYPEDQGFDINKGGHEAGSPPGGYYTPYENPKLEDGPDGEYLTDRLTDESVSFVREHKDEPFFLFLSFYSVHTPIQACKRHVGRYHEKAEGLDLDGPESRQEHDGVTRLHQDDPPYASMVHAVDENVGRLLDTLDELELTGNTIVVFTSDNGGLSTRRNRPGPTAVVPLRAGKGWCYEGGIRVPMILRAPGVTDGGTDSSEPAVSMDFYPTLLELAGMAPKPGQHRDGRSLVPLLKGEGALDRDVLYWHYPFYHGSTWTPGAAIRVGDWKLVDFYHEEKVELYNLANDPAEMTDLSRTRADKRHELETMLHTWQEDMGAKMPRPNPDWEG